MGPFETLFSIVILALLVYGGFRFLQNHFISCPKCSATMKRVHKEHPIEPYYLDYAFRCMGCRCEVEGGHEDQAASDD